MKKITAIIRPLKLDDVKESLNRHGIAGLTVSEVKGVGKQGGRRELFPNPVSSLDSLLPKICLEIVVPDEKVEAVIEAILDPARMRKIGDGKIFVQDVEGALRVRTGERDEDAL